MLEDSLGPQYKMGPDSPYLEVYKDYTEWPEYQGLFKGRQERFDQAVHMIMENPLTTAEDIKLDVTEPHRIGGIKLLRRAAGVDYDAEKEKAKENEYREFEARAVRFALRIGLGDLTIPKLRTAGFGSIINTNHFGSFRKFKEYLTENEFDRNGYPIPGEDI